MIASRITASPACFRMDAVAGAGNGEGAVGPGRYTVSGRDWQDLNAVNTERMECGAGTDHISDRVIGPDLVEMGLCPVDLVLGDTKTVEDPPCHCQGGYRYFGCGTFKPCHHFVKGPVSRRRFRLHFECTDPGPGDLW